MDRADRRLARLASQLIASPRSPASSESSTKPPAGAASVALGDAVSLKTAGATNQTDAGRTAGPRLALPTCQFYITAEVRANVTECKHQMREVQAFPPLPVPSATALAEKNA